MAEAEKGEIGEFAADEPPGVGGNGLLRLDDADSGTLGDPTGFGDPDVPSIYLKL